MIYESKMKEIVLICFDLNNQNACFKYDGENLSEFVSSNEYHYQARLGHYKVGCVFPMDHRRWSFGPNSACCSIVTTNIRETHPTLKTNWSLLGLLQTAKVMDINFTLLSNNGNQVYFKWNGESGINSLVVKPSKVKTFQANGATGRCMS